jgi:hypothetical protein
MAGQNSRAPKLQKGALEEHYWMTLEPMNSKVERDRVKE